MSTRCFALNMRNKQGRATQPGQLPARSMDDATPIAKPCRERRTVDHRCAADTIADTSIVPLGQLLSLRAAVNLIATLALKPVRA